jgi:hypothetical protein
MSKGSYYPRAPFNGRHEPVTRLEIDESGQHWNTVRDMRNTLSGGVHKFRSKREVAMAVLLWEIRQSYDGMRDETLPDTLPDAECEAWFENRKRMEVLIKRIDECLTMNI